MFKYLLVQYLYSVGLSSVSQFLSAYGGFTEIAFLALGGGLQKEGKFREFDEPDEMEEGAVGGSRGSKNGGICVV